MLATESVFNVMLVSLDCLASVSCSHAMAAKKVQCFLLQQPVLSQPL